MGKLGLLQKIFGRGRQFFMGLWPTHKELKALRPLTPTLSPDGGEGVSGLISWFLLATDYWLLATFQDSRS